MTVKQMADIAGVSPDTIRRAGKEVCPAKFEPRKKTVFNKDEAVEIMQIVRKKNFVELPQSAARLPQNTTDPPQTVEVGSSLTQRDLEIISGIVTAVVTNLNLRMGRLEGQYEKRKALLPPPGIPVRKQVSLVVNRYCHRTGCYQIDAYQELYREFNHRFSCNVHIRAKNAGVRPIEVIEEAGLMGELLSLATVLFTEGV